SDLARDVAVEILGRDDGDLVFSAKRGDAVDDRECKGEAGECGFHERPVSQCFECKCNIITFRKQARTPCDVPNVIGCQASVLVAPRTSQKRSIRRAVGTESLRKSD